MGETVKLRRAAGTSPQTNTNATVLARVTDFAPSDLVGEVIQGARRLIVLAEDLTAAGWPEPPRKDDKAIVRSRVLNIESVDDSTRRVAGVLIAYELTAIG